MLSISGFILLSTFITACSGLFLTKTELYYHYNAIVRAGTLTPVQGSSDWTLNGTLRLQVELDKLIFKFEDLSVSLYNGKPNEKPIPKFKFLPIPEEAKELLKPFVVHYDEGKIKHISVHSEEPVWSINMKRALASVFQLEEKNLESSSFSIKEDSLFGNCNVEYTVINLATKVLVRKFIDHLSCKNYPKLIWKNTSPLLCPSGRSALISTSGRKYILIPTNGTYYLQQVEMNGGADVQPFHAQGELNYAFINQSLKMTSYKQTKNAVKLPESIKVVDLTYEIPGRDFTQGRAPLNDEEYLKMVDMYLKKIIANLEIDPSRNEMELVKNEHIPHLLYFLSLIRRPYLEQYYNTLAIGTSYYQETHRNLFLKLLPQVGSDDAILLIEDLVHSGKQKGKIAIELLTVLPFYIRHPSEDLLKLSEKLLTLGEDVIEEVKQSAVLTFSIMIHKICKHNCRQETLEKYITMFVDKFTNSHSYSEQVLYLEVLNNIEVGNVLDYLIPIVQGNVSVLTEKPHHIRFLGVWASMSQAIYNADKFSQLYWPILTNHSEHLEMRVAALTMLMLAKPTHSNFINLLWFMQSERNAHLQHFYYTTLESLIETQYPCYTGLGTLASYIIRYIQPPPTRNWATGNYILDYTDPKYGFGGLVQLFAVANQRTGNPNVFYLLANSYASDQNLRQFAIYLKLEGVGDALKEIMFKTDKTTNVSDLLKIFQEIKAPTITSEPIHIEIIAKIEDRVVYCQYINKTNFNELAKVASKMNFLAQEVSINYQTVKVPVIMETTLPTDLGIPLLLRTESTVITSIRGNFTKDGDTTVLSRRNEIDLRYAFASSSNLMIYNPVLSMWHAARRTVSYQCYFPIVSQLSIKPINQEIKLGIINPLGMVRGFTAHAKSSVNIYGKGSLILQKYCPSCNNSVVVTTQSKRNEVEIFNANIEDFGTNLRIYLKDCEHSFASHNIVHLVQNIFSERNKNSRVLPISRPILGIIHSIDLFTLIPPKGSCGLGFIISSTASEDSELILSGSLNNLGLKVSLDLKSAANQKPLKSWLITSGYNVQNENTKYILQLNVTRASGGQAHQKICVDSETIFPKSKNVLLPWKPSKDVTSKINVTWGNASESCVSNGGEIHIVARGEVTKEQKEFLNDSRSWPHAACLEDSKNIAEWGKGYTPITEACYKASVEAATLRKYTASLTFSKVPESVLAVNRRILAVMDALTPGMIPISSDDLLNLTFSLKVPLNEQHAELTVNAREMVLPTAGAWLEPFLLNTCVDFLVPQAMKFGALGSCVVNSRRVISIDNKTLPFSASPRYSLVAGDCTAHPEFAVFVRRTSETKPLAAKLFLKENTIEIRPVGNEDLHVYINNERVVGDIVNKQEEEGSQEIIFHVQHIEKGLVRVTSDVEGIWLQHNGNFLALVVPSIYRGQLCGLCGDFNGDANNDSGEIFSF